MRSIRTSEAERRTAIVTRACAFSVALLLAFSTMLGVSLTQTAPCFADVSTEQSASASSAASSSASQTSISQTEETSATAASSSAAASASSDSGQAHNNVVYVAVIAFATILLAAFFIVMYRKTNRNISDMDNMFK